MQRENPDGNPYNNGFEYGVRHLLSPRSGLVSEIVLDSLPLSSREFFELLELGSVYVTGRRLLQDVVVDAETYIRVHTKPRRFPKDEFAWRELLVFQNESFVVVNKPAGLPVHASVDNILENLQKYLSSFLKQELYMTHRLDVPTRGLLVFAKTKQFQSEFNGLLTERAVEKIYRARVEVLGGAAAGVATGLVSAESASAEFASAEFASAEPVSAAKSEAEVDLSVDSKKFNFEANRVPPGVYTHYMQPSPRAPKSVSLTPNSGWQECRLRVLTSCALDERHQELEIELLTGRTHQIRAQLSALGAPIRGDTMYGATKFFEGEEIDLTAISLRFFEFHFSL